MRAKGLIKTRCSARISRITSGGEVDHFQLEVTDRSSGLIIASLKLDDAQFANLLSNRQANSEDAVVNTSGNLGKTHEYKTVNMPFDNSVPNGVGFELLFEEAENQNLGWTADRDERFNSHRYSHNTKTYQVTLRRWV